MQQSFRQRRSLVVLLVFAALAVAAYAADYCVGLDARLCDDRDYPTGYTVKKCGTLAKPCGIELTKERKSPCTAAQKELLPKLVAMCTCSEQMGSWLSKAPALTQPGSTQAIERFTGLDDEVLEGVVKAVDCLERAGFPPHDVNQVALMSKLEFDMLSVKSLAGIKKYTIIELAGMEAEDFQSAMTKAEACRDGGAPVADPSSVTSVPSYCKDFVQWYDDHAATATKLLIPMVNEIQRVIANYLNEVLANLEAVASDVGQMVSSQPWEEFFQAAAEEAYQLECDDPTTCYQGLLADPWKELHELSEKLTGSHPALDLNAKAAATVKGYVSKTQAAFCDGTRKTKDTEYRQLSIYRAFWTSLNAADYPQSKLVEHPKFLSDMLVHMSGVTFIRNLEIPAGVIRQVVAGMHETVHAAIDEFQGRYQAALSELADDTYNILAVQNNKPPRYCGANHTMPAVCDVNKCDAATSPVMPPACAAGTRCITDACNNCQAVCVPMPVSSSDAGNVVAILSTWTNLLRKSDGLSSTGAGPKDQLDKLLSSLNYLYTEGTGQGDRVYVYKAGLLTYNEEGRAYGKYPCLQGTTRKCLKYRTWTKCLPVPRIGNCDVKKRWTVPNELVGYVAVHSGLSEAIYQGLDRLDSYYRGPSPVAVCK